MFVGHYAAAFALKGKETNTSLGMLFIATQFVDILFFPFVMLGIENLTFVENFTAVNDFDMDYYPYTHGLLGSVLWAGLFYILYYFFFAKNRADKKSIAWIMALGVLSHWFVDLIAHSPDLPLITGEPKFGLGLWYNKLAAFVVEAALLIVGWVYYMKRTQVSTSKRRYLSLGFVAFLIIINFLNFYVLPASSDITELTISALFFYFLLAGIAAWVDRARMGRDSPQIL